MQHRDRRILVYGSVPHVSGTFTLYRQLRRGLASHGWDVRCVSVGKQECRLWQPAFVDDGCIAIASGISSRRRQARAFVEWCERERVDVVMPINSVAMLSSLRHLPPSTRIVTRCPNSTDYGYRIVTTYSERISRILASTPRHVAELSGPRYRVPADKLTLIPHGLDLEPYRKQRTPTASGSELHIAFLGRLEHEHKGVRYLPGIVEALRAMNVPFRLSIAGAGPDYGFVGTALTAALNDGRVRMLGELGPSDVPSFLGSSDVLLFPSRSEGFGLSLLEGMASGCVPVASRLNGITDFIVDDGTTGFLCEVGAVEAFAAAVAQLDTDRELLAQMSIAARKDVSQRFALERLSQQYADVLDEAVTAPRPGPSSAPWISFRLHPTSRPKLRRMMVPPSVRARLSRRWPRANDKHTR